MICLALTSEGSRNVFKSHKTTIQVQVVMFVRKHMLNWYVMFINVLLTSIR